MKWESFVINQKEVMSNQSVKNESIEFDPRTHDVYLYAGDINLQGYESLSHIANQNERKNYCLLVLFTNGGNPHAGFRIARALQCYYNDFDIYIPRFCKSAGSLITIGAKSIYMDDMSELGPLDVQLKKKDELFGLTSGLDIAHTLNHIQNQAMTSFRAGLLELSGQAGLSTKMAADIASNLTGSLFQPIMAQVDPMKLSETQRALEIAQAYGTRLNEKSLNLKDGGLDLLITGYPSHGFVIDRKEAKKLFNRVCNGTEKMRQSIMDFNLLFQQHTASPQPLVYKLPTNATGEIYDQTTSDTGRTQSSNAKTEPNNQGILNQAATELQSSSPSDQKNKRSSATQS